MTSIKRQHVLAPGVPFSGRFLQQSNKSPPTKLGAASPSLE